MQLLRNLTGEQLKSLYNKNNEFANLIYESCYNSNMLMQEDEGNGVDPEHVLECHSHYYSFYLTAPAVYGVTAPELLAGKLDPDYMTPENAETYRKLCEAVDAWENMDADEQDADESGIYEKAQALAENLAEGITDQLRAYETIDDEQIAAELDDIREGWNGASDWETDGAKVYQTIVKCYA